MDADMGPEDTNPGSWNEDGEALLVGPYAEEGDGDTAESPLPQLPAPYVFDEDIIVDNRIGQLLVRHRVISLAQLEACLALQPARPGRLLGEVVVEEGHATMEDINGVLKLQLSELRLGQILTRCKLVSQEQLDIALAEQEATGELLGSILIGFGYCSPELVSWAIDQQNKDS